MQLQVVGDAYRYQSEEHQHQHIAQSHVGQMGGVEETEHHTEYADDDHLKSAIPNKWQAHEAGQAGGGGNDALHLLGAHPPLRTGTLRAEACGAVVGALGIVHKVVDEIGVYLHDKREQYAERCCHPVECARHVISLRIGPSQRQTYHHRHGSTAERLRPGSQHPCLQGVFLNHSVFCNNLHPAKVRISEKKTKFYLDFLEREYIRRMSKVLISIFRQIK